MWRRQLGWWSGCRDNPAGPNIALPAYRAVIAPTPRRIGIGGAFSSVAACALRLAVVVRRGADRARASNPPAGPPMRSPRMVADCTPPITGPATIPDPATCLRLFARSAPWPPRPCRTLLRPETGGRQQRCAGRPCWLAAAWPAAARCRGRRTTSAARCNGAGDAQLGQRASTGAYLLRTLQFVDLRASTTLGLTISSPRSWFSPRVTRWPYSLSLSRMKPSASRNWTSTSTWNGSRRRDSTVAIHAIRANTSFRSVTRVRHPVTSHPSCAAAPVTATASTAADSRAVRLARSSARPCSIPGGATVFDPLLGSLASIVCTSSPSNNPDSCPGSLTATPPRAIQRLEHLRQLLVTLLPQGPFNWPSPPPQRPARNTRAARDPTRGLPDSTRYGVELHRLACATATVSRRSPVCFHAIVDGQRPDVQNAYRPDTAEFVRSNPGGNGT